MAEEDLGKEIKELSEKMERLEKTIREISSPYSQVLDYLERFQEISRGYFRLLEMYERYGTVSPEVLLPGLKDPISIEIVKILFDARERNISQITRELKNRRGTASRRIVRERLQILVGKGAVDCISSGKSRKYRISQDLLEKWSQLLALPKYEGQPYKEKR
ncbi:MAG: ArsR family transcriptional regulator [Thermoplasmata archaeon]